MTTAFPIVNGRELRDGRAVPVLNPYDGSVAGECVQPDDPAVEAALSAAHAAHRAARPSARDRKAAFRRMIERLEADREGIARTLATEAGKPIRHARAEVDRSLVTLTLGMEEAGEPDGEILDLSLAGNTLGRHGLIRRFPVGVVLGITPFNFPANLVCHKLSPALACGAPFLLKPASKTPLTGYRLIRAALDAGFPTAAAQFLPVSGRGMASLAGDGRVAMITFTGSSEVGWALRRDHPRKRVALELGGNAAVIVDSARDLPAVARKVALGAFAYAGQVCISVQRVLVARPLYDGFRTLLADATRALVTGDPLDERTDVGPMIDGGEADRVMAWIAEAKAAGATALAGGERSGNCVPPCLLENVPRDARLWRDEVFGPACCLAPYDDFEQALDLADDTRYGLQAGLFTDEWPKMARAFERLEVGGIVVNDSSMVRADNMPYGGAKESGTGREGVRYAIGEMTERRVLVVEG